jgi:hypothetical protein
MAAAGALWRRIASRTLRPTIATVHIVRHLSPSTRHLVLLEHEQLKTKGVLYWLRWNGMLTSAWLRDRFARRRYRSVDEGELQSARRSDTVFIFGSGYSLNDITPEEWEHIAAHDTFGFNGFYHQDWIDVDFQILRGGIYGELRWRPFAEQVAADLRRTRRLKDAIFLLQGEYVAQFTNQLIGYGILPRASRVFRYRTSRSPGLPERTFRAGIKHETGTLSDAVHCAYCLGWKHIVLVGVDLYDARYFWLGPDETLALDRETATVVVGEYNNVRNIRYDEMHNTARHGIVELMGRWNDHLAADGVRLSVWNPRSLLAEVLPVYESTQATSRVLD